MSELTKYSKRRKPSWLQVFFKTLYKKSEPYLFRQGSLKKGDEPSPSGEHVVPIKKRTPTFSGWGSLKKGDDILSHITAVPSAQAGLTSLFGMGRGEPRRNNHLKVIAPSNSPNWGRANACSWHSSCHSVRIWEVRRGIIS